jgi:hypothetical protein
MFRKINDFVPQVSEAWGQPQGGATTRRATTRGQPQGGNHKGATTRVAPTERFVGATLVVALVGVII